jgi:PAS domain S-box-containing protein
MGDAVTADGAGIDRDPLENPRARDSLLTAVIDNAPFGAHMYRLDDDDRLVFIGYNRKAEEMLGIEHHALIGLTLEEAFPGNLGTDTPAEYKRVAREGGVWDLDQYSYDASGIAGVFEVHAFWFGQRRVCVFFRDVTEKRKSELELRAANEMLAVAQRAAGTGFWSWDVPTGQLTWTPEFLDLFGLPDDAPATFETWRDCLHPDDAADAEAMIQRAVDDRIQLDNEYRIVLPDGSIRWIGARGTTEYGEDGAPLRMAGICIDIGEKKRREEEIRALNADLERRVEERTRELSLTNRELQDFVYSASHDLRAPLRALDGFSEVLLEDCGETLDEKHIGYLRRIRAASQHMAKLIDALLALSRVGRREIDLRLVDLSAASLAILEELREAEPDRKVSVSVEPELQARTDEALADIVLRNIIGNAWKFTSQLESASIEIGSVRRNGRLMYFVRDDGAGFDPEYAAAMFRPFHRLHRQDEFPGTGIGLATVQRALDKLDGRCWAEGAPGRGATFFFTLG